jgi:hypothetical protein
MRRVALARFFQQASPGKVLERHLCINEPASGAETRRDAVEVNECTQQFAHVERLAAEDLVGEVGHQRRLPCR